jgi:DNA transposition AAA+ family ATPase
MHEENEHDRAQQGGAFEALGQDGQRARTARMLGPDEKLTQAQCADIRERVLAYIDKHEDLNRAAVARQNRIAVSTLSDVLTGKYGTRSGRKCTDVPILRRLNNWMEADSRRRNIIQQRAFVETAVAREIIQVAEIVSETCKIGVVYGPAQIGKSFTVAALEGSDRLGMPIVFRINQGHTSPKSLACMVCERIKLPTTYGLDRLTRSVVAKLKGTRRMLVFDEVERVNQRALEWIRDVHDETGCPVLLVGKPAIYQRLGLREMGSYREVTDQFRARVVIQRDLTLRTRRSGGGDGDDTRKAEPLFSREDIRKLIKTASIKLRVTPDAIDWLQARACCLGGGGVGMTLIYVYLAYKVASAQGLDEINGELLAMVEDVTLGEEGMELVDQVVSDPGSARIRKLA